MIPEPLHPAVVHFPIVLAFLLPVAVLVARFAISRGTQARSAWLPVVALALVLTLSTFVATRTGEAEEETVEMYVPEAALHEHEEAGERLRLVAVLALAVGAAGLAGGRMGHGARLVTVGVSFVVAGFAVPVGHSGGGLVYTHGAASAYTQSSEMERDSVPEEEAGADEAHHPEEEGEP